MVDVLEAPITSATVTFEGTTLIRTSEQGVQEYQIPDGTPGGVVRVSAANFWDAEQNLSFTLASSPPTVQFNGPQAINARRLAVTSRGADFNLEVHFVLGQLRDAAPQVNTAATAAGISLALTPTAVPRFATPILNPGGTQLGLLNMHSETVSAQGPLLFAERVTAPKLLAVVHPGWNNPRTDQQRRSPNPFHLFLHPMPRWDDPYPFGVTYVDFVARYLLRRGRIPVGKAMAYQNLADTPKNVFVFPVGHAGPGWPGDLVTQSAIWRLFHELNYWLQRMRGVSFPTQPVGRSALSCFSAGAGWLASILSGARHPEFYERVMRHICVLDGVVDRELVPGVCAALAKWYRGGSQGRSLRVYTQSQAWTDTLLALLKAPIVARGPGGAREASTSSCTILHVPTSFWDNVLPFWQPPWPSGNWYNYAPGDPDNYWRVHQWIPALFMEHAITNSAFNV
jgi:hypothetical protein